MFFVLLSTLVYSDVHKAKVYYKAGLSKYKQDDLHSALKDLEKAFQEDPTNKKIKALLLEVARRLGTAYYQKKDYEKALPYLTTAYSLAPENDEVFWMYKLCVKEVNTAKELKTLKEKQEKRLIEEKKKREEEKRRKNLLLQRIQKEKIRTQSLLERKLERERKEKEALLRKEIAKLKKEELKRRELELKIQEKQEKNLRTRMNILFWSIVSIFITLLVLVYVVYLVVERHGRKRSKELKQHLNDTFKYITQENDKFLKKVEEFEERVKTRFSVQIEKLVDMIKIQADALSGEVKKVEVTRKDGTREVITDVNPHLRARANAVEVIEKTVDDPLTGEKLLEPFLNDKDNRTRANAAKGLYKYNPERAMALLSDMVKEKSKWMRLSASWALGEIGSKAAVDLLLALVNDNDEMVRERTLTSLKNIALNKKAQLPYQVYQKIVDILKEKGEMGEE